MPTKFTRSRVQSDWLCSTFSRLRGSVSRWALPQMGVAARNQPLTTWKRRSLESTAQVGWVPASGCCDRGYGGRPTRGFQGRVVPVSCLWDSSDPEQIPPRPNKNTNWIYWIQGVCLNESLASFVFGFGRMMLRFLHGNPLYTLWRLGLIVGTGAYSSIDRGHICFWYVY